MIFFDVIRVRLEKLPHRSSAALNCNKFEWLQNDFSRCFDFVSAKLADPDFEVVSENVLESRPNDKFKKMEYTIKLTVNGKTFFGSGFTKKAAKMNVATEAWNIVRTGSM